jgi:hypothetical protein
MGLLKNKAFLIFVLIALLGVIHGVAQKSSRSFSFFNKWSLGINGGPNLFVGDLPFAGTKMNNVTFGYSLVLGKQVNNWLSIRAQALNGKLAGSGSYYDVDFEDQSYAAFNADVFEYNLSLAFDFTQLFNGYNPDRALQLYGMAGGGFSNWKTLCYNTVNGVTLHSNGSSSGSGIKGRTLEPVIPIGFGINWKLNDYLKFHTETSLHTVKSDVLDGMQGGLKYDMTWYTGAGLTVDFDLKGSKGIPLMPYEADAERLPVKYKDIALDLKGKKTLKLGAMPEIIFTPPKHISDEESFPISVQLSNDGAAGVVELECVIPEGFSLPDPGIVGFVYSKTGQVVNLLSTVPAIDTTIVFKIYVGSSSVPVGSYPFYFSSKFTDITGESTKMKFVDYIEKDLMYNNLTETGAFKLGVEFRVQLISSKGVKIPNDKLLALYEVEGPILEDFQDGYYQYTTGSFNNLADAESYRDKLKNDLGTNDLYVVFFQNGSRISTFKAAENASLYIRDNTLGNKTKSETASRIDEFRIEIKRSQNARISINEIVSRFETPEPLKEDFNDGWYYIYAGSFKRKDVAHAYMQYLNTQYGFAEMKIIAFSRGKRLE